MTDRYQSLRDAIAAGPTPGPWYSMTTVRYNGYSIRHRTGDPKQPMIPIAIVNRRHPASDANRDLIAAADPDTIRALLDELDALRIDSERYRWALPILTAGREADARTMSLAMQLLRGLDGDAAIDAARGRATGSQP